MNRLHLFVHTPKTGGTSFKHSVIYRNIAEDAIYHYRGLRRFCTNSLEGYRFVDGHFPYGIHFFTRKKCVYYSLLREPMDQAVSFYYFVKQCKYENYRHPKLTDAESLSLVDFTRKYQNMQSFQLAGFPWNFIYARRSEALLEMARKHLFNSCECYGLLEQIESFEAEVASRFGWGFQPLYDETKRTKSRPRVSDLSGKEYGQLREILSLDIRLYDEAKHRLSNKPRTEPS